MKKTTKLFQDFPCTHRAWRYRGNCKYVHGYCRSFKFIFTCEEPDRNGWVMDFGGLKQIKEFLMYWFDHTFLVAKDDPFLSGFVKFVDNEDILFWELEGAA